MEGIAWKLTQAAVGFVAAQAAKPVVAGAWKVVTNRPRPTKKDVDPSFVERAAYAALSTAIVGVITMYAQRRFTAWLGFDETTSEPAIG